jgi:gamma-glutamylcyclotransferase (GGCT)/AIG2-like uncharacterized protein YtfP
MLHRIFVYGTLKEGFRNHHVNLGTRLPGDFMTEQPFPLYVIGEFGLPWLCWSASAMQVGTRANRSPCAKRPAER